MIEILETSIIGLMSGTSLDGLDICFVRFWEVENTWQYEIEASETVSYSSEWIAKLLDAEKITQPFTQENRNEDSELMKLNVLYGEYLGKQVLNFITKNKLKKPLFIASHGHTIFHQPAIGYTFQLGCGATIKKTAEIPVVCDFRTLDVSLGGQGAPLVPVGDELLFSQYKYCLNLGGIANISFDQNGKRLAFDICAVNYVFNRLAKRLGKNYDENGDLANAGTCIPALLQQLNALPYYTKLAPKSLGREWIETEIFPLLTENYKTEDLLRTYTEHATEQIANVIQLQGELLLTGGGTHNTFFVNQLRKKCSVEIIVPDLATINFKEALIFGFLGLLKWNNRINTLASVTGASRDSSGGSIFK